MYTPKRCVADVSAMCSVERGSITASIEFDRYRAVAVGAVLLSWLSTMV